MVQVSRSLLSYISYRRVRGTIISLSRNTVCKPTPVVRIRVRRSVIRIRIGDPAIRIRIVVRPTNDTARIETVHRNIFLWRAVFLSSDRFVLRFHVFSFFYHLISIIFLSFGFLKASRPPTFAPETEEALSALA